MIALPKAGAATTAAIRSAPRTQRLRCTELRSFYTGSGGPNPHVRYIGLPGGGRERVDPAQADEVEAAVAGDRGRVLPVRPLRTEMAGRGGERVRPVVEAREVDEAVDDRRGARDL